MCRPLLRLPGDLDLTRLLAPGSGGDHVQTEHTPPPPARKRAPSLLPGVETRPHTNVTNVKHHNSRETAQGRSHSGPGGRRAQPGVPGAAAL